LAGRQTYPNEHTADTLVIITDLIVSDRTYWSSDVAGSYGWKNKTPWEKETIPRHFAKNPCGRYMPNNLFAFSEEPG
jgi:hypothetical protein